MSTLYELSDTPMFPPHDALALSRYEGKVLLVYNAAAL
jgi:hypothetical protein